MDPIRFQVRIPSSRGTELAREFRSSPLSTFKDSADYPNLRANVSFSLEGLSDGSLSAILSGDYEGGMITHRFKSWRTMSEVERSAFLNQFFDALRSRMEHVLKTDTLYRYKAGPKGRLP